MVASLALMDVACTEDPARTLSVVRRDLQAEVMKATSVVAKEHKRREVRECGGKTYGGVRVICACVKSVSKANACSPSTRYLLPSAMKTMA